MKKINTIPLTHLRNDIHFQFCTDFKNLIIRFNPVALKVESHFNTFRMNYEHESECLRLIVRSSISEEINNTDHRRAIALHGLMQSVKVAVNHFNPGIVTAAKRIRAFLKTYEQVSPKTFTEESAAIDNLLQGLQGKYVADAAIIGIIPWIKELEEQNRIFSILLDEDYLEASGTTALRIKNVREQVDRSYWTVVEKMNALMIIENNSYYEQFALELNNDILRYKKVLAQRQNKYKKKEKTELQENEVNILNRHNRQIPSRTS